MGKFVRTVTYVLLLSLVLTPVGGTAALAAAGDEAGWDDVSISVQPEYDDPRVLAVLQANVEPSAQLPRQVEFLLPDSATAPEIGMACEVVNGGHECKVYDQTEAGGFTGISYNIAKSRELFFEYYWDPFKDQPKAAEGRKSFKYEFKAPVDIKSVSIGIQEPLKTEEFKLDPAPAQQTQDQDGLKYNVYNYTNIKKGQVLTINADYVKTDPVLSKPKGPGGEQASAQGVNQAGSAQSGVGTLQVIMLTLAVLFAGGVVAAIKRSQSTPIPASAGVKVKTKKTKTKANTGGAGAKFCSECGNALEPDMKFCSGCGGKV